MNEITKWKEVFENYYKKNPLNDNSHNIEHFRRVWKCASKIMDTNVDKLIILAASYFHDIVNYPKNHPDRSRSSRDAAAKTEKILNDMNFPKEKINNVLHCIEAHSFSANIKPITIEAKIIQDSDRMEALGAIGLARAFYVAGKLNLQLFDEQDPLAKNRELDDKKYALDHFKIKLLKLPTMMQTKKGKIEAKKRADILIKFSEDLLQEL